MEIQLLLDGKVLWSNTIEEMQTNMVLNHCILLRSPSSDAEVKALFDKKNVLLFSGLKRGWFRVPIVWQ